MIAFYPWYILHTSILDWIRFWVRCSGMKYVYSEPTPTIAHIHSQTHTHTDTQSYIMNKESCGEQLQKKIKYNSEALSGINL